MSFFSDLFKGNFSNLGNDLSPSNVFSDFGSDTMKVLDNPVADVGIGLAALTGGLALAPELAAGFGAADAATAGAGASLGAASDVTAGADLSFLDPAINPNLGGDALIAGGEASAPGLAASAGPLGFGANTAGFSPAGLPLTSGGVIDMTAPGVPADIGDVAAYGPNYGATAVAGGGTGAGSDFAAIAGADPSLPGGGGFGAVAGANPNLPAGASLVNPTGQATSPGFLSSVGNFFASPAGRGATALAGLGGLGFNLFQGYESKKALDALSNQENALAGTAAQTAAAANKAAGPMITSGNTLMSYLTTNTLPPQFQASIDQQVSATKAAIIQGYTSRGMSGDPKQNSQLTQDLANVDQQALILKGNLESTLSTAGNQMVQTANQLMSTGLNATQLSAEIPIQMAKLNLTINQQMQTAIANFAASLNGGQRTNAGGITLNLGSPVNQQGALTVQ